MEVHNFSPLLHRNSLNGFEETKDSDEKAYFVVSHSNILQCAVTILELNDKLNPQALKKSDFDFHQNAWTLELVVQNNELRLENLHDGVPTPKPETDNHNQPNILLKSAPSTMVSKNSECIYDAKGTDFTNTLPFQNRDYETKGALGGGIIKKMSKPYIPLPHFTRLDEPCFSTTAQREQMAQSEKLVDYRYKNVRNPPEALLFNAHANGARIYISRHGNSCNNITDNIFYKKQDPSLSNFGVWSLLRESKYSTQENVRPKALDDLYEKRLQLKVHPPPVYVSCCIRTWQTACLIYKKPNEKLELIVAPYLKEKGSLSGNMPDSIDKQRRKMNAWINRNLNQTDITGRLVIDGNVQIYMQNTAGQKFLIYNPQDPTLKGDKTGYDVEHKSYYPDGIQKFCKWLTDLPGDQSQRPEPSLDADYAVIQNQNPAPSATRKRNWLPTRKMMPSLPSWNQFKSYVRLPSVTMKNVYPRTSSPNQPPYTELRQGGKRFLHRKRSRKHRKKK